MSKQSKHVERTGAVSFAGHWYQEALAGGEAETDLISARVLPPLRNSITRSLGARTSPVLGAMRFGSATPAVVNGAKAHVVASVGTKAAFTGAFRRCWNGVAASRLCLASRKAVPKGEAAGTPTEEAVDEVEVLEEACEAAELAQLGAVTSFSRSHLGSWPPLNLRWSHRGQSKASASTGSGLGILSFRRTSLGHWNCFVSSGATRHMREEDDQRESNEGPYLLLLWREALRISS